MAEIFEFLYLVGVGVFFSYLIMIIWVNLFEK